MSNIFIFTKNPRLLKKWKNALSDTYIVQYTTDVFDIPADIKPESLIILDTSFFIENTIDFSYLEKFPSKVLIMGNQYPENLQIQVIASGASGYCENNYSDELFLKAVKSVLNGEIWLQRHLLPKVIGAFGKIPKNKINKEKNEKYEQLLKELSNRELDVAKMIGAGKTNKVIASSLDISERTVKAHLTSIYKKLHIPDRLHLAISISEINSNHNSA
jgi:DNA-binding NarL/FixJ family response regulator